MNILVSGSHGFIGSALIPSLTTGGHRVIRLVRSPSPTREGEVSWDPARETLATARLGPIDALVHLAGENLAAGRWTAARKASIRESRIRGTRFLCETLAQLPHPPKVVICASAIGYYGDRGEELLTEESSAGSGFLAQLCQDWEAATEPAVKRGIRVVNLRTGIVLSPAGGALAKMLLPFKLGVGGRLGSGVQYMSWVSIDDVVGAIDYALANESLSGPVNVVAPTPVTNREFTKTLGRVLSRPTVLPAPAFVLRLVLGQLADEALLSSARVSPTKLLVKGYHFRYPNLEAALRHVLGTH